MDNKHIQPRSYKEKYNKSFWFGENLENLEIFSQIYDGITHSWIVFIIQSKCPSLYLNVLYECLMNVTNTFTNTNIDRNLFVYFRYDFVEILRCRVVQKNDS